MRLCRMRRECSALDGVSPALRAGASDFGKTQSHQRSSPPLVRPTDVGFLRLTLLSNGTRRWAVHGPAPLARHPTSRPGQESSPQRIRGGSKPCQPTASIKPQTSSLSPPGEGWGEGNLRTIYQPNNSLKQQLLTNSLNRLRFLSTSSFHVSIRPLMIAIDTPSLGRASWKQSLVSRRLKAALWGLELRAVAWPTLAITVVV